MRVFSTLPGLFVFRFSGLLGMRPFVPPKVVQSDVCVFGGTSAGVAAAVEQTRRGLDRKWY